MIHTRLTYSVSQAAHVLGISKSLCYRLMAEGRLRFSLHPGSTLRTISSAELDRYAADLEAEEIAKGA
jgi:excisionase family DNA binding protein